MNELSEKAILALKMDLAVFVVHAKESRLSINDSRGYTKQGFWYFAEKKAKFRGIFAGKKSKFAEKSADLVGEESKFAEKSADFAGF